MLRLLNGALCLITNFAQFPKLLWSVPFVYNIIIDGFFHIYQLTNIRNEEGKSNSNRNKALKNAGFSAGCYTVTYSKKYRPEIS